MVQTKSVKRARRVGRQRKFDVQRAPDGRAYVPKRAEEEAALSVALEARVRHGLARNLSEARDPRSATLIGRLYRDAVITAEHHTAAELYARAHRLQGAALGVPAQFPRPGSGGEGMSPEQAREAIAEWGAASQALRDAGPDAAIAVRMAVHDGCGGPDWSALRRGLSALCAHYGPQEKENNR